MRTVVVRRSALAAESFNLSDNCSQSLSEVREILDGFRIPDGFGFVTNDDGTLDGCEHFNRYLLDAQQQSAYDTKSLREFHMYNLGRLLRFVRRMRAQRVSDDIGVDVSHWLLEHGEPRVDLTDVTSDELKEYAARRGKSVAPSSLPVEFSSIINFYRYAASSNWIPADPVPRWNGRVTLFPRGNRNPRVSRFLNPAQTSHFLRVGLRGDGSAADSRPAYPERDYCYGLLLATAGLRREEAALLLDQEVPASSDMPPGGVHSFERTGKGGVTRLVYVTDEAVRAIDLYRQTERVAKIETAQRTLRRLRREGNLLITDGYALVRGKPAVVVEGRKIRLTAFSDEDRKRAVRILDDGTIEPMALFLARGGLPPDIKYWNELFADARARVHASGHAQRPPAHVSVTPHTMRHTFAVRMLAGLMRQGGDAEGNPYAFLANPVLTVKELLGHSSVETTHRYLYAAESWQEEIPQVLREVAAQTVGHTSTETSQAPGADGSVD